ncbi:MAG TPA: hypothetical protein VJT31_27830 [Rugosimonospora sp.]|nr:hypothetical protein [Rugosimonospora sp.]
MTDDLSKMPLGDADRLAREQIEHHRDEMGQWRRARAARVATERAAGRSVPAIASELGVHVQVVYDLLRQARDDAAAADQPGASIQDQ